MTIVVAAFFVIGGGQLLSILRGPTLPDPPSSPGSVAVDLAYFRMAVLANEGGLTDMQRRDFEAELSAAPIATSTDDLGWIAMRAARHLDNAHSQLLDPRMHRLPIRVHWFNDGLYVVKTRPEKQDVLGRRILNIGGVAPEMLLQSLSAHLSGNDARKRYRSEYFLVAPRAVAALGAAVSNNCVEIEYEARAPLCADSELLPADAFWEWLHVLPGDISLGTAGWSTWKSGKDTLPLYLRDSKDGYVLFDVPELDATYVRLNGSINDGPQSLEDFLADAMDKHAQSRRRHFIADFRFNWGGGYDLTRKFTEELPERIAPGGRIFLIVGPNTFSAGLLGAARLKHFGGDRVTVVGEDPGDHLKFRAEGFVLTMPVSKITFYVSKYRHDFQNGCRWLDDCYVLDKFIGVAVRSLQPQIRASNTAADYTAGNDSALEAIRAALR